MIPAPRAWHGFRRCDSLCYHECCLRHEPGSSTHAGFACVGVGDSRPSGTPSAAIVTPPMELREKVANLPRDAGVYLFKDALGTTLYVGKAGSLRSRVRSYFLETRWADAKTGSLV